MVHTPRATRVGEPVWEIAELFPEQGYWTEDRYLALQTNRLVEFDNGMIEVLPAQTKSHQMIALYFFELLKAFVSRSQRGGLVLVAGYRLRIPTGQFREPDVLYLTAEQDSRASEQYTETAELVMEAVSPDDPDRDYVVKREEYARASIPEYWIIDAKARRVLILSLENGKYVEAGSLGVGEVAASRRLPGFQISVNETTFTGR